MPFITTLKPRYYPYVILGYGVAGRAALAALLERDPAAKVLVVDARGDVGLDPLPTQGNGSGLASAWMAPKKAAGVEFARGARATALNADLGLVTLTLSSSTTDDAGATNIGIAGDKDQGAPARNSPHRKQEVVAFGRCLLALGSRPRPPPPGFIDPSARGNVALLGARDSRIGREELKREVEAGAAVTVVGSSWQALELACWLQEGRSGSAGMEKVFGRGGKWSLRGEYEGRRNRWDFKLFPATTHPFFILWRDDLLVAVMISSFPTHWNPAQSFLLRWLVSTTQRGVRTCC